MGLIDDLAAAAQAAAGVEVLQYVSHPGCDTRWVMGESMTRSYRDPEAAAAYLVGVIRGALGAGTPDWVASITGVPVAPAARRNRKKELPPVAQAWNDGFSYGRRLARQAGDNEKGLPA